MLVLENTDLSLTNHWLVGDTLEDALRDRSDKPDEIMLVDTAIEQEWTVWSIYRDSVMWPDDETDPRFVEFKSGCLTEV